MSNNNHGKVQLRQPRLAEMVADILRERILSGELEDGDTLPKQEDLLDEFNVSKPSIREALRILETEGLVTVRRGNLGGAVVHVPQAHTAAYMLGLVLESKSVSLTDVGMALQHLEPAAAALCAALPDRSAIVERLTAIHDATVAGVEDDLLFTQNSRRFHEEIVSSCGNETVKLVVGALETLWSAQEQAWAEAAVEAGEFPEASLRQRGLKAHERILKLIAKGDSEGVQRAAHRHLGKSQLYALSSVPVATIDSAPLRRIQSA